MHHPNLAHPLCPDAWWLFDPDLAGGNVWYDVLRERNGGVTNGTLMGTASWANNSLEFNSGYVATSLRCPDTDITWVAYTAPLSGNSYNSVMTAGAGELRFVNGSIEFVISGYGNWTDAPYNIIADNQLVHVAMTIGSPPSAPITLFFNGEPVVTGILTGSFGGNFLIGWSDFGPYFGSICDVSLFYRELTPPQVLQLYTERMNGYPTMLLQHSAKKYFQMWGGEYNEIASGGAVTNGSYVGGYLYPQVASGGAVTNGSYVGGYLYPQVASGGIITNGTARPVYQQFFVQVASCTNGQKCGFSDDDQFCADELLVQSYGSKFVGVQRRNPSAYQLDPKKSANGSAAMVPAITLCRQKIRLRPQDQRLRRIISR